MHLRKQVLLFYSFIHRYQFPRCLQHPYLYAEDIEPRGLPPQETHEKLIDGSAKLRFLKALLPKLKARGHRVLLFSQVSLSATLLYRTQPIKVCHWLKCH